MPNRQAKRVDIASCRWFSSGVDRVTQPAVFTPELWAAALAVLVGAAPTVASTLQNRLSAARLGVGLCWSALVGFDAIVLAGEWDAAMLRTVAIVQLVAISSFLMICSPRSHIKKPIGLA
jgi:hypothetical protein